MKPSLLCGMPAFTDKQGAFTDSERKKIKLFAFLSFFVYFRSIRHYLKISNKTIHELSEI